MWKEREFDKKRLAIFCKSCEAKFCKDRQAEKQKDNLRSGGY
jgi:hypothetical protein